MKKKLLAFLLAAIMVVSLLPVTALADSHVHSFTYAASGATITATCTEGCDKGYNTKPLTLTLSENGFKLYEEKLAWKEAGLAVPAVSYYSDETLLEKKPTSVGSYVIKATIGGATASYPFTLADAPSGFTTDENFRMAYNPNQGRSGYDFKGFVSGKWQQISYWGYTDGYSNGFAAAVYNDPDEKLTVTPATPEFVADGQAIQMTYTVTNNESAAVNDFRFYIAADTMIAGNDASLNEVDKDNVVTMTSSGVALFALSTTEGGTAVPTFYNYDEITSYTPADPTDSINVNSYIQVLKNGADPSKTMPVSTTNDSAFVMYFPLTTLQPGESAEYNFVIGMGSEETIQDIIKQVKAALGLVDYKNEKITGLKSNTTYNFEYTEGGTKQQFEITSNEKGEVSLSGQDDQGQEYSFIGKNVKYWEKTGSQEQSQELEIKGRPQMPEASKILPEDEQDAKPGDVWVKTVTENSVTIIRFEGYEYQYSINSGKAWIDVPADGEITDLPAGSTIKIRTRIAATNTDPASEYSDPVSVTLKKDEDNYFIPAALLGLAALGGHSSPNFVDVAEGDFFYDAVQWAVKNDITKGVDNTHFAPYAPIKRAEVVTFLWRTAGCPKALTGTAQFTDVTTGSYYEKAVAWAIENGITKGTSDTTFSPDEICQRGEIVTFLARFAGVRDADTASSFTDVSSSDFFAAAVAWAKANGITEGITPTTFRPYEDCNRAQVVTFLYRYMVR